MQKVSVIVPVYNAEKYVAETIQSLLNQTYENFEVIIVDDGSPDQSIEICKSFNDSRLRFIEQENRGLAGARNTGIRNSIGDYVSFLDADDLWHPEKLEKHVKHLDESPEVGLSFSYSEFIDGEGNRIGIYQIPRKIKNITPSYALCRNPPGNGSAVVVRRETLEDVKFPTRLHGVVEDSYFDETFKRAEDLEFWTRIATHTKWKLEGIAEALTLYRVNIGGLSANVPIQYEAIERVIEKSCDSSPEILGPYKNLAQAYYLRYSARRAVTLRDASMAVSFMNRAIVRDWRIWIEEPRRTFLTVAAAYALLLTPRSLYEFLEKSALKTTGSTQRAKISQ